MHMDAAKEDCCNRRYVNDPLDDTQAKVKVITHGNTLHIHGKQLTRLDLPWIPQPDGLHGPWGYDRFPRDLDFLSRNTSKPLTVCYVVPHRSAVRFVLHHHYRLDDLDYGARPSHHPSSGTSLRCTSPAGWLRVASHHNRAASTTSRGTLISSNTTTNPLYGGSLDCPPQVPNCWSRSPLPFCHLLPGIAVMGRHLTRPCLLTGTSDPELPNSLPRYHLITQTKSHYMLLPYIGPPIHLGIHSLTTTTHLAPYEY